MIQNSTIIVLVCSLLLSACGAALNQKALVEKYTNTHSKFMLLDGNQIHYRDEGKGEVVVLLHGTASSLHTWDSWVPELSKQYRVIRMDLPGFGLTGPDQENRYEVEHDVAFLSNFLAKLGLDSVHLVGSSLGGRIAWEYSVVFPDEVKSLTLMDALGYPQASWPPAIEMAQWPVLDFFVENASPRSMFEIGLKEIYFDTNLVTENLINRYYELAHYPGNMNAFPKRVKAKLDTQSHQIKNISVPTLILWGEEDLYFPVKRALDFEYDISSSSVITYSNVGHLPMEEVPIQSVNDFKNFLKTSETIVKEKVVAIPL